MAKKPVTKAQKPKHEDEPDEIEEPVPGEQEDEPEVVEPADDPGEQAGEPDNPPAGSLTYTVEGEGSFPLTISGGWRRIYRGQPVELSADELALLKERGEKFHKVKKG